MPKIDIQSSVFRPAWTQGHLDGTNIQHKVVKQTKGYNALLEQDHQQGIKSPDSGIRYDHGRIRTKK